MLVPGSQRYFVPCLGETPDEHHKQSLKNQQFGVPSHEHITELVDRFGLQAIEAKAGSVIAPLKHCLASLILSRSAESTT